MYIAYKTHILALGLMKSLSVHVGMGTVISVLSNQMQGALLSYLLKLLNTKFINALSVSL